MRAGDRLALGPLAATIVRRLRDHPRLVALEFEGPPGAIWEGLARHGRPIQYAHVPQPLVLWDTWTPIAGPPVAFEPPSAGFVLDWRALSSMAKRGVRFATITHAAGMSSTGDPLLDALLPFDEPYRIPERTAREIVHARAEGRRVIAIGTTVVRALEHAAARDGIVRAGEGLATQRIGPSSRLRVVDAILSGTHEPGSSHYELLRAFADDATLGRIDRSSRRTATARTSSAIRCSWRACGVGPPRCPREVFSRRPGVQETIPRESKKDITWLKPGATYQTADAVASSAILFRP